MVKPQKNDSLRVLRGFAVNPLVVLTLSFLVFFKDWFPHFTSKIFLGLDSTVLYYPIYYWVHQHIPEGKLPLICDLAYHGAPVAAVSMAGVLSPFLWLFHFFSSTVVVTNLLFLAPHLIFLFGTYFLGRRLGISTTGSLLLAFLWAYSGQRMAQLDHWNVAWACAFFPWAFQALVRYKEEKNLYWLLLAGLFWGFNLLSGHPQIFFLEGLFFLFWIFLSPGTWFLGPRTLTLFGMSLLACGVASPLILFTAENLGMDGFHFQWGEVDKYFHSWTPFNFITLIFPWFFGKEQFDRAGSDYWWQYQFVEMQVAFSVAGLFFILFFLRNKNPQRRWILWASLFGILMAMGKFFFLYPLLHHLPVFSWFRDPDRYWHLAAWALGLGAAYAWDEWFQEDALAARGRKLALDLGIFSFFFLIGNWILMTLGRPLLESLAAWGIQHFLLGDPLHTKPLGEYLARLPEKLNYLSFNLDPRHPRVYLPLLAMAALGVTVWNRKNWSLNLQKSLLLALVFADLMCFRMPLGNSFVDPASLPPPAYPAPQNRSLVLLSQNTSPLPNQYTEMAYPNMNLVYGRPNLVIDANPAMPRYGEIMGELGWFSWVYKNRDPEGFVKNINLLRLMGIDQVISDVPLSLPKSFMNIQQHYPYVYGVQWAQPKAYLYHPFAIWPWKESLNNLRMSSWNLVFEYDQDVASVLNSDLPLYTDMNLLSAPYGEIENLEQNFEWDETKLSITARTTRKPFLILQKTYLPGWKALLNGKSIKPLRCNFVLTAIPTVLGENHVELRFEPVSLRLGFFLFFLFFAFFTFHQGRRLSA